MNRQYLFLLLLLCGLLSAQQNLIPNGGFERYQGRTPRNWSFDSYLAFERSSDSHSGKYAAKVWGNDGTFHIINNSNNPDAIEVEGNTEYKFSFWHKGTLRAPNILVVISWYKDDKLVKREYMDNEKVTSTMEWQQKEMTIKSPIGINKAGVLFRIYRGGGYALIDDVSMVFSKKGEDKLPTPTEFKATAFQREIELSWDKEADEEISWEVSVNGGAPQKTTTNKYIIDKLELNKQYTVNVRAIKGEATSDYATLYPTTKKLNHEVESLDRIPHLRTLGEEADCPQDINLYYTDLANIEAQIKYYIDGKEVQPNNGMLHFPKTGKQRLKVLIDEGGDKQWEIDYKVDVK